MKIEKQPQDNCTLTLTVEVDDERVQPALKAAARRLSQNYRIPGFRPGKAPFETIVRHVGEGAVYNEALEKLGQEIYQAALEQENIDAFAPGELENIEQLKPLVLKFTVPLKPEVELGDYRANLRVPYTPPEVQDSAVDEALEHMREHQAETSPVERPAELGDVVTLDAKGFLNQGENPSDFLLADQDVSLVLDEKADWPVVGFAPQVVGLSAGQAKQFDLTFPEDYANASMRGQVAHFEVTAKEVKQRTLPEWNDELAKSLGDYESLEDLRRRKRDELVRQAERSVKREYADKVLDQLVDNTPIKYPPMLLEQELDSYLEDLDQRLHEQRLTLDDYLKIQSKTREQFREEVKPQAERRLKRTLILGRIVDLEGLRVDEAEVNGRIDAMSAAWGERAGDVRQTLDSDRGRTMIRLDLLSDQAVDRLVDVARGAPVPDLPAPAEPEARPEDEALAAEAMTAAAVDAATDQATEASAEGQAESAPTHNPPEDAQTAPAEASN